MSFKQEHSACSSLLSGRITSNAVFSLQAEYARDNNCYYKSNTTGKSKTMRSKYFRFPISKSVNKTYVTPEQIELCNLTDTDSISNSYLVKSKTVHIIIDNVANKNLDH